LKHTDRSAAAVGERTGALGTGDSLEPIAMFRQKEERRPQAEKDVWCGSRRRLEGSWSESEAHRPIDGHVPPLICFSYMSPSALNLSRQPLVGGGMFWTLELMQECSSTLQKALSRCGRLWPGTGVVLTDGSPRALATNNDKHKHPLSITDINQSSHPNHVQAIVFLETEAPARAPDVTPCIVHKAPRASSSPSAIGIPVDS
jgi:hypothetical protein